MAVAHPRGILNTDLLSLYEERLRRIVEECYEVAFILCNSELEDFGLSKIFDVFNQTFTTAFILNTGYWPFFSSVKGKCLCVCGRFGLYCRHVKNEYHWIDMQPVNNEQGSARFFPKIHGNIYPQDYDIIIKPMIDDAYGYNITTVLNLHYRKIEKGKALRRDKNGKLIRDQTPIKKEKDVHKQSYFFTIHARFNIHPEYYPAMFTIVFQPNPFFHDQYGTYFKKLCKLRTFEWSKSSDDQDKFYHVSVGQMPTSTLVLQHVNVPVFSMPNQILVIYPQSQYMRNKSQKFKRNKSSQTPWKVFDEEVRNLSSWVLQENALSDSIRSIASSVSHVSVTNSMEGELILMDDSEEYDNQLPNISYNKAIKGSILFPCNESQTDIYDDSSQGVGQGIKRKYSSWSMTSLNTLNSDFDSCITYSAYSENDIKPFAEATSDTKNGKSYSFPEEISDSVHVATSGKQLPHLYDNSSKINLSIESKVSFPYLSNEPPKMACSKLNYSKALKKSVIQNHDREAEWFEKTFPPLKTKLNQSEIDEEFDLIETVIQEDVSQKENNLIWWNATNKK